jgi:hypothetical protein
MGDGFWIQNGMAKNASLQRDVVTCGEYPQTRSAGRRFGERTADCANTLVISGEKRGIETGKDFCQGMKYQP